MRKYFEQSLMAMSNKKHMNALSCTQSNLTTAIFSMVFILPILFIFLHTPPFPNSTTFSFKEEGLSRDLRNIEFSWNRLTFSEYTLPPRKLKIAVFSRKWPSGATPGGMERHAHTLHTALAQRGHTIHVFTSHPSNNVTISSRDVDKIKVKKYVSPSIHYHEGEPGQWRYQKAWEIFKKEHDREPFDVVHSESVSLPHWLARTLPNLAVSWHGIALEILHSSIYQHLALQKNGSIKTDKNLQGMIPKVLKEIGFFRSYQHHVATSDSCGEILRDVYQIPRKRVHVIINGVDENYFKEDSQLGSEFRSRIGVPPNASLVLGVSGRLVKDKGHPLLFEAFSILKLKHPNIYLVVVGSGPWKQRYQELGRQVFVLGSMEPSQLRGFYNGIDVFVNPTLRTQGLDLTLMEVMLTGKPILASRFPSIKGTVIVKDEFGFMFSPNVESLLEALEDVVAESAVKLRRRGKACRKYALSMFTAHRMTLAYERLFLCIRNETWCTYNS